MEFRCNSSVCRAFIHHSKRERDRVDFGDSLSGRIELEWDWEFSLAGASRFAIIVEVVEGGREVGRSSPMLRYVW